MLSAAALSELAPSQGRGNRCYSAALFSLLIVMPRWWSALANLVTEDRLFECLTGAYGPAMCQRALLVLAMNDLVETPSKEAATHVQERLQELLEVIGNRDFQAGEQADPSELIQLLADQICLLAEINIAPNPDQPQESIEISTFTGQCAGLSKSGPNLRALFEGDLSWHRFVEAIQIWQNGRPRQPSAIFATSPIPVRALERDQMCGQLVAAITVDDTGYRQTDAACLGVQPRHYDLTIFYPNGQIFRVDHGRTFPIQAAQLANRMAVLTISAPLRETAFANLS